MRARRVLLYSRCLCHMSAFGFVDPTFFVVGRNIWLGNDRFAHVLGPGVVLRKPCTLAVFLTISIKKLCAVVYPCSFEAC